MRTMTTGTRIPADQHRRLVEHLGRIRRGCPHLDGAPVVLGCVQHLDLLRCVDCADAHTATHTEAEEHLCDVCGGSLHGDDGDTWHVGMLASVPFGRFVILGPTVAYVETVTLIGWGSCFSCHVDAEIEGGTP